MMINLGGRERTHDEYRDMLGSAGFDLQERHPLPLDMEALVARAGRGRPAAPRPTRPALPDRLSPGDAGSMSRQEAECDDPATTGDKIKAVVYVLMLPVSLLVLVALDLRW